MSKEVELGIIIRRGSSAALEITGAAGSLTDGQTLTLSGTGFGVKSPAAPEYWENLSGRSDGDSAAAAGLTVNTNGSGFPDAAFDNGEQTFQGRPVLRRQFQHDSDSNHSVSYMFASNTELEVYSSYYEYTTNAGVDITNNQKDGRIFGSQPIGDPSAKPSTGITGQKVGGSNPFFINLDDDTTTNASDPDLITDDNGFLTDMPTSTTWPEDVWVRFEKYVKRTATTNDPSGAVYFRRHGYMPGTNDTNRTGVTTRGEARTAQENLDYGLQNSPILKDGVITTVENGSHFGGAAMGTIFISEFSGKNVEYTTYVAEMYVDFTIARVEIVQSSSWNDTPGAQQLRYIQPPTAWTNTSISVTVNESQSGGYGTGSGWYAYVVTADGEVSNGFHLDGV